MKKSIIELLTEPLSKKEYTYEYVKHERKTDAVFYEFHFNHDSLISFFTLYGCGELQVQGMIIQGQDQLDLKDTPYCINNVSRAYREIIIKTFLYLDKYASSFTDLYDIRYIVEQRYKEKNFRFQIKIPVTKDGKEVWEKRDALTFCYGSKAHSLFMRIYTMSFLQSVYCRPEPEGAGLERIRFKATKKTFPLLEWIALNMMDPQRKSFRNYFSYFVNSPNEIKREILSIEIPTQQEKAMP